MEKLDLSAGEKKVLEYIERIKNGEDKETILKDLPSSFAEAIEKGLNNEDSDKLSEEIVFEKVDFDIKESDEDKLKADQIRDNLSLEFVEKEDASIKINETEVGFGGEIIVDGKSIGHFSIYKIDENKAYIHDVQIGYDIDAPRNKGYGFEAYKKIIDELNKRGVKLTSTDWSVSNTSVSPQALRVWEKLEQAGYVKKVGETNGKIHDRFTGETKVQIVPVYESITVKENIKPLHFEMFNGAVIETIKQNYEKSMLALSELKEMYFNNKNTISDGAVDIISTLGAATNQFDFIKLVRGDKELLKKIIDDFDKAFGTINKEKQEQ